MKLLVTIYVNNEVVWEILYAHNVVFNYLCRAPKIIPISYICINYWRVSGQFISLQLQTVNV